MPTPSLFPMFLKATTEGFTLGPSVVVDFMALELEFMDPIEVELLADLEVEVLEEPIAVPLEDTPEVEVC